MKKKVLIPLVVLILIILGISFFLLKTSITGYTVKVGDTKVSREVLEDTLLGIKNINLNIDSPENILAIKEELSSGCEVLDYVIDGDFEIFEFNEMDNEWIIADRRKEIKTVMRYTIDISCDVLDGEYYITSDVVWCDGADITQDGKVNVFDLAEIAGRYGYDCSVKDCRNADTNGDGKVNIYDLVVLARYFGSSRCVDEIQIGGIENA